MSREFNIRPQDMKHVKVWHVNAMIQHLEELNKARG
jgi:hypothetical protein